MRQVRQRHPDFPVATGRDYGYDQPAQLAHIGGTLEPLPHLTLADFHNGHHQ